MLIYGFQPFMNMFVLSEASVFINVFTYVSMNVIRLNEREVEFI